MVLNWSIMLCEVIMVYVPKLCKGTADVEGKYVEAVDNADGTAMPDVLLNRF